MRSLHSSRLRVRWRAVPASAPPLLVGISENQPTCSRDPLFTALGVKHARVVAPWNVMTAATAELGALPSPTSAQANAQGVEPLVTFEHTRGDASSAASSSSTGKSAVQAAVAGGLRARVEARSCAAFPTVKTSRRGTRSTTSRSRTSRNPHAGRALHRHGAASCCRLHDRRRRRARPGRRPARPRSRRSARRPATSSASGTPSRRRARSAASTTTPTSTASARPARRRSSRRSAASSTGSPRPAASTSSARSGPRRPTRAAAPTPRAS